MQIKTFKKSTLVAAMMLEITTINAATIEVDNNNCKLADAITAANNDSIAGGCSTGNGDDTINLIPNSSISLTEAMPGIINNVTINANGSTIERDISSNNQFSVITGGNLGTLPTIEINDAVISGGYNIDNYGGGISIFAGSLILNNSTVSSNQGGGISVTRGESSQITNSIISDNNSSLDQGANYYGGGISVSGGNMNIKSSTVSNNVSNSASQLGGGLYLTSYSGNAIINISNSTISNNTATSNGGGIQLYRANDTELTLSISNTTIINNNSGMVGGGIYNLDSTLNVEESLISGNTATTIGNNIESVDASVFTSSRNLFGFNNESGLNTVSPSPSDIVPGEANLSDIINTTLADNGGTTPTHNLVEGSPAIDALTGPCAQNTDQAGNNRPVDGNGDMNAACDIGAIEFQIDLIFANGFEPTP